MKTSSVLRSLVLSASLLIGGCAGASWQQVQVAPAYQPPKEVKVALLVQATTEHSAEAGVALQRAITEALAGYGVTANFVPAAAGSSAAVTITDWNQGSRAARWLVGFGAGEGAVLVAVKIPSADGQAGVDGTARGWVRGGSFGGDSYDAAAEAGKLIANAIATGKAVVKN